MLAQEGVELLVDRAGRSRPGGQILGGVCYGLRPRPGARRESERRSANPRRQRELATRSEHAREQAIAARDDRGARSGRLPTTASKPRRTGSACASARRKSSLGCRLRAREIIAAGVVHREHRGSPLGRAGRHVARAGGEIEQPRPRAYGCGVQERLDQMAGDPAEEAVSTRPPWLPSLRPQRR